jgi:hypothetical protein
VDNGAKIPQLKAPFAQEAISWLREFVTSQGMTK